MGCSSSLMVFSLHLSTYKKIMFKMEKLIMLRTEIFKIGLFWINSNSFIRETRFSKFVLLACTQLCRYDSEMSFGKLREDAPGVFHLCRAHPCMCCCQGSVSAALSPCAETAPRSSLQSVHFWKTMKGIFCYLISFPKVTVFFVACHWVFHRNKELQSELPFGVLAVQHSSWRGWADSGAHYPALNQKVLWVI